MLLSEFIKLLTNTKKHYGDMKVMVAADEEGNAFGNIRQDMMEVNTQAQILFIYPADSQLPEEMPELQ